MIVNAKKLQAIFISKKRNALSRTLNLQINNTEITQQSSQELFAFTINNELKYDQHISRLCKSAECQLNVLYRLKNYLNFEQRNVVIESSIYVNLNITLWSGNFGHKSTNKIGSVLKRTLQFLFNGFKSNFFQVLKKLTKKCNNYKNIALPLYRNRFQNKPVRKQHNLNLNITKSNKLSYSKKSLEF